MIYKKCSKCGKIKPFSAFNKNSNTCKECKHINYMNNRESILIREKNYRKNKLVTDIKYKEQYYNNYMHYLHTCIIKTIKKESLELELYIFNINNIL